MNKSRRYPEHRSTAASTTIGTCRPPSPAQYQGSSARSPTPSERRSRPHSSRWWRPTETPTGASRYRRSPSASAHADPESRGREDLGGAQRRGLVARHGELARGHSFGGEQLAG